MTETMLNILKYLEFILIKNIIGNLILIIAGITGMYFLVTNEEHDIGKTSGLTSTIELWLIVLVLTVGGIIALFNNIISYFN